MSVSGVALTEALGEIVGPGRLLTDPAMLERHAVDGAPPRWVAVAGGVEELSRLVRVASEERLAVIPRGGGHRMGLGNPPARVDLVVELSRISQVIEHSPEDLTVTVQAGATLSALAASLAPHRQFLALDPLAGSDRSVGGVMATNDSGPLRFRYGTARDLLLGVRFVQADGTLTWGGARVVKSVTGYDVPKLLVGSLGTLGVLCELTFRLHPVAPVEGHWLIVFPSRERAGEFLASVLDSSLQPSRLELLNGSALVRLGLPPAPAAFAVTIGSVAEAVKSQGETLVEVARRCGAERHISVTQDFWSRLADALSPDGGVVLKLATLPSLVLERLALVETLASARGASASLVGEAGNGILHCRLAGDLPADKWERELIVPLRAAVASEGGSVVVEAAPRALKERADVWGPIEPGLLDLMQRLKAEFDPRNILNPGRFVGRI